MAVLLAPVPVLLTLVLIIAAVLPWGGPEWSEMALSLLPIAAIYFWSLRRPHLMPALAVFALGLVLDVLSHSPLGVWTCAALIAALAARHARRTRPGYGWMRSALHVVAVLTLSTGFVAGLLSAYAWTWVPAQPIGEALLVACLAYPVLAGSLSLVDAAWPAAPDRALFLRGD
jgi:rod shape-determining protein MreD